MEIATFKGAAYVSSNRWHFFFFFDVSLFLLFSDNSTRTLSNHFMFLFNRMLLQGLSSMLSALRPIAAYDA